jgi:hypothetical protein
MSPSILRLSLLTGFCVGFTQLVSADPIQFQSEPTPTQLLELYTSEGCSSCPPAEAWLSRLKEHPKLWRDFVPVAFHVDYWDYLGWRDPWGAEQFSDRQHAYAAEWRSKTVYTPEFVLNGKEWRNGSSSKNVPEKPTAKVGILSVIFTNASLWQIRFTPTSHDPKIYEAHAVWLASDVTSDVTAGENQGKRLKHDFAALSFAELLMKPQGDGFECKLHSAMPTKNSESRLALAVWITEMGKLEPIQATGGWLPKPISKP